jgi:hypothetical protein
MYSKFSLCVENKTLTLFVVLLQRRRMRSNIRAQVVVSFEEAARGAKRTIRVTQGVPTPKNVDIEIPAGEQG